VGCSIVNDKTGIDAAVYDMGKVYGRLDTIKAASVRKPSLTNGQQLADSYNLAAAFINSYWTNVIGDVDAGMKIDRPLKAYEEEPEHQRISDFYNVSQKKLSDVEVKQGGLTTFPADNVIKIIDDGLKKFEDLDQKRRENFKNYLKSLRVVFWSEQFTMPAAPDIGKQGKK
jgi:hypothetical protein